MIQHGEFILPDLIPMDSDIGYGNRICITNSLTLFLMNILCCLIVDVISILVANKYLITCSIAYLL